MISLPPTHLLHWLTLVLATTPGLALEENPVFSVQFGKSSVAFAGRIDSEEASQSLAEVVKGARPDLGVITEGLIVDPSMDFPNTSDITSILAELGLSTHEGRFEIWPDRVLIGGLTDSLVTLTALKIRLEPILEGRRLINQICIVGTEYLPAIKVSLSSVDPAAGSLVVKTKPSAEEPFEAPGLLIEKLFPTLLMLSQFDRIEGKTITPTEPLRALPLELTTTGGGSTVPLAPAQPPIMIAAAPAQQYETLPSVRFSRSSFLLQANQSPIFDELAKHLLAPDRKGRLVVVESVRPNGGSSAFNDYLCERRTSEVIRFLSERGIDVATITSRVIDSQSPIDEGEVRLRVEIPAPTPETSEGTPPGPGNPAKTENETGVLKPFQPRDAVP